MNKIASLIEARNIFEDTKIEIEAAEKICKKIDPLLPPTWKSNFIIGMWRGLLFCCHAESFLEPEKNRPSIDFRYVCDLVEKATSTKVNRKPWIEGDKFFCLRGITNMKIDYRHILHIEIRQINPSQCSLEYEDKTIRQAKLTDECLGIMGENQ